MKTQKELKTIFSNVNIGISSGLLAAIAFSSIPFLTGDFHSETRSDLYAKAKMIENIKNGMNDTTPGYLVRSGMKTFSVYDESYTAKANGHNLANIPVSQLHYAVPLPLDANKFLKNKFNINFFNF